MSTTNTNKAGLIEFIPGRTRTPEPKSYYGLDLGQRKDHSALAALDLTWTRHGHCPVTYAHLYQPSVAIRALVRFPLGTNYDKIHRLVTDQLDERHYPKQLIIDAGGPGPPIVDRFRESLGDSVTIRPVMITGGKGQNTLTGGYTGIPRRTLITTLLLAIGAHSLTCEEGLQNWDIFESELIELRGDTAQPGDSNAHDDLVMAVALALNAATNDTPELLPATEPKGPQRTKYGYIDKPLF